MALKCTFLLYGNKVQLPSTPWQHDTPKFCLYFVSGGRHRHPTDEIFKSRISVLAQLQCEFMDLSKIEGSCVDLKRLFSLSCVQRKTE